MNGWWVQNVLDSGGPALLVSWIVVVIGSITLHELSHGWMAVRRGDRTPIELGHMTWNPVVHMGPMSLVLFALIGIAWGAMPVDRTRIRGRWGYALTIFAGPAINFLLAGVAIVALGLWTGAMAAFSMPEPFSSNLEQFFRIAGVLNIVLGLFNLLPVLPLDGGRILAEFWGAFERFAMGENGRWLMFGGFLLFVWFAFGPLIVISVVAVEGISMPISIGAELLFKQF